MSYEVLLLGLLVGVANYCFRYLPLRLRVGNARPTKRGAVGILLDTIGIASICALLVVSTAPEVMHDTRRFVPTLVGFAVLGAGNDSNLLIVFYVQIMPDDFVMQLHRF